MQAAIDAYVRVVSQILLACGNRKLPYVIGLGVATDDHSIVAVRHDQTTNTATGARHDERGDNSGYLFTLAFALTHVTSTARLETGVECHAAIDEDARAVDVVGLVGSQPRGHSPDVVDFADSLIRDEL